MAGKYPFFVQELSLEAAQSQETGSSRKISGNIWINKIYFTCYWFDVDR